MEKGTLCAWAQELGFAEAALCDAKAFEAARRVVESQPSLAERKQLRFDPQGDFSWVKSLAVLLWAYTPAETPSGVRIFVDSYYEASNAAYHAARRLEERLAESGCRVKANVSYPAKEAAVRAGLGVIGKNSLLITEKYGTHVVIILLATDVPCEPSDEPVHAASSCLNCGRCAQACPSMAIDAQGMSHPERCMRNFMMEGVVAPEYLRARMDMRLLGCDICQQVCPMQPAVKRKAPEIGPTLDDFVTLDEQRFSRSVKALADVIGRNAARPQRIRAQAAVLAGNSKKQTYLPVLHVWAESEFEAVREHARWAIAQIEEK